jgi:hypothetical protein
MWDLGVANKQGDCLYFGDFADTIPNFIVLFLAPANQHWPSFLKDLITGCQLGNTHIERTPNSSKIDILVEDMVSPTTTTTTMVVICHAESGKKAGKPEKRSHRAHGRISCKFLVPTPRPRTPIPFCCV